MSKKKIDRVYVMGKKYSISSYTPNNAGLMKSVRFASGLTNDTLQTIQVSTMQAGDGFADTMLHEILHAIDYQTQLDLSERQVHVLATALLQTVWDNRNKNLFEHIFSPQE